jgi:hypothetical protein
MEREVYGERVRDGKEFEVLVEDLPMGIPRVTIGVRDELNIQRDCHDMLLPLLQRKRSTWKVLLRIRNLISPPKSTKASAVSAEEFTQILQIVVQARRTPVAIFNATRWWTRSPTCNTC